MTEDTETGTAPVEPTLEQIASEFQNAQPSDTYPDTHQSEAKSEQPRNDNPPTDPSEYTNWLQQQKDALVSGEITRISKTLDEFVRNQETEKTKSDLKSAVNTLSKSVEDIPEDLLEGYLHVEFSRNPSFQKIWNNRAQNPTAFNKALALLGQQLSKKAAIRRDPQLTENVRAAKQAEKDTSKSPVSEDDPMAKVAKAEGTDFNRYWERIKRGEL